MADRSAPPPTANEVAVDLMNQYHQSLRARADEKGNLWQSDEQLLAQAQVLATIGVREALVDMVAAVTAQTRVLAEQATRTEYLARHVEEVADLIKRPRQV